MILNTGRGKLKKAVDIKECMKCIGVKYAKVCWDLLISVGWTGVGSVLESQKIVRPKYIQNSRLMILSLKALLGLVPSHPVTSNSLDL